jgi:predicted metal-dependent phosphotriesterase family hydrolase
MTAVQTALGPVNASALGPTLMHEHIFILTADVQQNYPEEWGDEDARAADAVRQLRALAAAGIKTIVDVTVIGQGRYVPRIRRVAEQVPELNIVVATGCYTFDDVPLFFWRRTPDVEASLGRPARDVMADFFLRDITEGIGNTGVKAGMLKCAVDSKGLTGGVERVLDWFPPGSLDDLRQWHYRHVSQDVLPYLREHGVTEDQIDAMLMRTPARILSGLPGSGPEDVDRACDHERTNGK